MNPTATEPSAASRVRLHDGQTVDLSRLAPAELERLQWTEERHFADRIRASAKGSAERASLLNEAYDTVVRIYEARTAADGQPVSMGLDRRYQNMVLRLLRRTAVGGARPRLFEIGFGAGALLESADKAGCDVAGIEVSHYLHQLACERLPHACHERLYLGLLPTSDAADAEGAYDVVYWNDVIEHLHTDEVADYLGCIHRILRRGGLLMTVTPNWHMRPSDVTRLFMPPRSEPVGFHFKEYTLGELTTLLTEAGFERPKTPLFLTGRRAYACGGGLANLKRRFEPCLEWLPFPVARACCRRLGFNCTIARKP